MLSKDDVKKDFEPLIADENQLPDIKTWDPERIYLDPSGGLRVIDIMKKPWPEDKRPLFIGNKLASYIKDP